MRCVPLGLRQSESTHSSDVIDKHSHFGFLRRSHGDWVQDCNTAKNAELNRPASDWVCHQTKSWSGRPGASIDARLIPSSFLITGIQAEITMEDLAATVVSCADQFSNGMLKAKVCQPIMLCNLCV
jgi:hypothetical protein